MVHFKLKLLSDWLAALFGCHVHRNLYCPSTHHRVYRHCLLQNNNILSLVCLIAHQHYEAHCEHHVWRHTTGIVQLAGQKRPWTTWMSQNVQHTRLSSANV